MFGGLFYLMESIKVKNIIIGEQYEASANYEKLKNIVNKRGIRVITVKAGNRLNIEKGLYLDILWPSSEEVINENVLNNNSIVCKLVYKEFSMLFTGDIEEIAEKAILRKYEDKLSILQANILKVAHHGSKTSSTINFLNTVKSKIALIGVGKDNNFGHPSGEVIDRLKGISARIYRTDEKGEINFYITQKEKIKIKEFE